eukprot:318168-Pleurochrysis_carterae.AAC.3
MEEGMKIRWIHRRNQNSPVAPKSLTALLVVPRASDTTLKQLKDKEGSELARGGDHTNGVRLGEASLTPLQRLGLTHIDTGAP